MVSSRPQRRVHTNAAPVQANLFARVSRIVRSYVNTVGMCWGGGLCLVGGDVERLRVWTVC